tara:strand:- start:2330 stop:3298 length:969 start_codon:yes stop_codon:yes gene_type:complete
MSVFWSYWIAGLTSIFLVFLAVLFYICFRRGMIFTGVEQGEALKHVYDQDLYELDQPLPRWWSYLFILMFGIGLIYLAFYPGVVAWGNHLGWASTRDHAVYLDSEIESVSYDQYHKERAYAEETYAQVLAPYATRPYPELMRDPQAQQVGARLFQQNCVQCHGTDAQGRKGYPNLTDKSWIYGGSFARIEESIRNGRRGLMPARGGLPLSDEDVEILVQYIRSLSDLPHDAEGANQGHQVYMKGCFACHGMQGQGNIYIGAPNLVDRAWLYGGDETSLRQTLLKGRQGVMPLWQDKLDPIKIRLLTAYVAGLSQLKDEDTSD